MDLIKLAEGAGNLGPAAILALGIIGLIVALRKGWLVTSGQVDALQKHLDDTTEQRDRLLDLALKNADLAKEAALQVHEVVKTERTRRGGA